MLARSGSSQATLHEAVPSASRALSLSSQAEETHTTYNGMVVKSDTPQVAPDNEGKSSCILFFFRQCYRVKCAVVLLFLYVLALYVYCHVFVPTITLKFVFKVSNQVLNIRPTHRSTEAKV